MSLTVLIIGVIGQALPLAFIVNAFIAGKIKI